MKKPLTFCLLATTSLLALAAMDKVQIFSLTANAYDALQLLLAVIAVGAALLQGTQRLRKARLRPTPLVFGIVAGTLAGGIAMKNPSLGAQLGGAGSVFAHTAIAGLLADALLCLLSYAELENDEPGVEEEGPVSKHQASRATHV
jgi:hypothetical protein